MTETEMALDTVRRELYKEREKNRELAADNKTATFELMKYAQMKESLKISLKDCVNELCLKCGYYREEHRGACDGCRWKPVRHGDFNDAGGD